MQAPHGKCKPTGSTVARSDRSCHIHEGAKCPRGVCTCMGGSCLGLRVLGTDLDTKKSVWTTHAGCLWHVHYVPIIEDSVHAANRPPKAHSCSRRFLSQQTLLGTVTQGITGVHPSGLAAPLRRSEQVFRPCGARLVPRVTTDLECNDFASCSVSRIVFKIS